MPEDRQTWPTWPLAAATAGVALLLVVPAGAGSPSWLDRLSLVITGRALAPQHGVVLTLALLLAARGILLRRRAAWYALVALVTLGVLAVLTGDDAIWRLPLLAVALGALARYRDEFVVRPHHVRVRTAIRTAAALVILSALACVVLGGVSVRSVGRDVFTGLGGSGFDVNGVSWLPSALALVGAVGLLVIVVTLLAAAPPPPPGDPHERGRVAVLVAHPGSDTLAPFALRHDKSYVFSPDDRAAIGYRVLFGVAVAGGDPVGDPHSYPAAIQEFRELCLRMGWRPAVLGASAQLLGSWPGLRSIGFGDEVVIRPAEFGLAGRHMRNVRQAVRRTRNAGVTTKVYAESAVPDDLRGKLRELASKALSGAAERGFSMNLDELLTGEHPGCLVVVAHDRTGAPVAFQRYASSGGGLSLDAMRRLPDAPNGLNERLIVEIVDYARDRDIPLVSLNFAAFRELLDNDRRGPVERIGYRTLHLLDPLIQVESLYLFDRKFHPGYQPRSVVFRSWADIGWVAAALLTLEFGRTKPAPTPMPATAEPRESYERS